MNPNFALSLSFDGITLLQRHASVWSVVDEVTLDTVDLTTALADLLSQATTLDPDAGGAVKLVIPNEQIRYLDLPQAAPPGPARTAMIEAALDGATPYAVSDLVYDATDHGGHLRIAAVARETLEEAENFARGHSFVPASFVAIAENGAFHGEVFFGPASNWTGPAPEREARAIQISPKPAPTKAPPPKATAASATDAAPTAAVASPSPAVEQTASVVAASPEATPPAEPTVPVESGSPAAKPAASVALSSAVPDASTEPATAPRPTLPEPQEQVTAPKPLPDEGPADPGAQPQNIIAETAISEPVDMAPDVASDTPASPSPEPETGLDSDEAPVPQARATTNDSRADTVDPVDTAASKQPSAPKIPPPPPQRGNLSGTIMEQAVERIHRDALAPGAADPNTRPPPAPRRLQVPQAADVSRDTAAPSIKPQADNAAPASAFSTMRASREPSFAAPSLAAALRGDPDAGAAPQAPALRFTPRPDGDVVTDDATRAPIASFARPSVTAPDLPGSDLSDSDLPGSDPAAAKPAQSRGFGFFSRRSAKTDVDTAAPESVAAMENLSDADLANARLAKLRSGPAPKPLPSAKPRFGLGTGSGSGSGSGKASGGGEKPTPASTQSDERERMTVFGARQSQARVGGKPRFLGLLLTTILLVFLAGVAAWASVFLDDGIARFFRPDTVPAIDVADLPLSTSEDDAELAPEPELPGTDTARDTVAALDPDTQAVESAPEGAPLLVPRPPERARVLTSQEAAATYAATGIWQRAPIQPDVPTQTDLDTLYVASIDTAVQEFDAVALPALQSLVADPGFVALAPPAPAGVVFDLDARGMVRATIEGAMNPDGILIYAGLPPVTPPLRSGAAIPAPSADAPVVVDERRRLQALRPKARPANLIELNERASLAGRSRAELAALRPKVRPDVINTLEEAATSSATDLAIAASVKPIPRPRDIERIIQEARRTPAPTVRQPDPQSVQVATVAPRTVAPRIPSSASVAKQATVRNAINLRKLNLIGVYGNPSSRRALIRLSNGRYQKVKVGDRIDGGRVAAISDSELRYTKGGRNVVLRMPQG